MALPGGGVEGRDAATREVREETDLRLDGARDAVGRIERARPLGARLSEVTVCPFVLRAPSGAAARVASREVASVHWFAVSDLMNRANRGAHVHRYGNEARRFPCIRIDGLVVWGAHLPHRGPVPLDSVTKGKTLQFPSYDPQRSSR